MNTRKSKTLAFVLALSMTLIPLTGCTSAAKTEAPSAASAASAASKAAEDKKSGSKVDFTSTYKGTANADDRMFGVTPTSDGGYIAVGNTQTKEDKKEKETAFYIKYNAKGTQEWVMQVPNTHLQAVIETTEGYLAVGNTTSTDAPFSGTAKVEKKAGEEANVNAAAVLFDKAGKIIWAKSFGGSGYDVFTGHSWSGGGYPSVLPNGNFLVPGSTSSNDGDLKGKNLGESDGILAEIDPKGNLVSVNVYGSSGNELLHDAIVLEDGSILISGTTHPKEDEKTKVVSPADGMFKGLSDDWNEMSVFVSKLDKNKKVVWTKLIHSHSAWVVGMSLAKDGGIMLASDGIKETAEGEATALSLYKLDAQGSIVWEKEYKNDKNDKGRIFLNSLRTAADGTVLISGEVHYQSIIEPGTEGMRGWLGGVDKDGNLLWERNFEGSDYELHIHAEPTADGGVILAAQQASEEGDWDAVLMKYAPYAD
jgi:hypothetical protein